MSFAQNKQVMDRFDKRLEQALQAALSRVRLRAALSGFVIFMVIAGVVVILWAGGRDLLAGTISAGDLSSFIFMLFWLPPRQAICQSWAVNCSGQLGQRQNCHVWRLPRNLMRPEKTVAKVFR